MDTLLRLLSDFDRTIVRASLLLYGVLVPFGADDRELLTLFRDSFREKKIQGIKEIRSATGMGLKDAKDRFEALYAFAEKNALPREPLSEEDRRKARTLLNFIVGDAKNGALDEVFDNNVRELRAILDK